MDDFLERLEHLFHPIDGWGEFRRGARKAAVVFVLYQVDGRWMVPFVRRRVDMRDHPGQVALPGGGVQQGESAWSAAQREVAEEIGVRRVCGNGDIERANRATLILLFVAKHNETFRCSRPGSSTGGLPV